LPELHVLRDLLMHKYGREFSLAVMENRDGCVSDRVVRKLDMSTPSSELVDGYLTEIAKAYSVEWAPITKSAQDGAGPEGGVKDTEKSVIQTHENEVTNEPAAESTNSPPIEGNSRDPKDGTSPSQRTSLKGSAAPPYTPEPVDEDDFEALARRFNELKKR
jgi:vacuolar protein sorting-associated protein IST1